MNLNLIWFILVGVFFCGYAVLDGFDLGVGALHLFAKGGFYLAVFLLIFSLIFRAIAIEFRSKQPFAWWRQTWDVAFCVASILCAFLLGVVIGNLIWGVPLGADKEFHGTFFGLLNPYALLCGVTVLSVCMMHGSIYVAMKTQGEFHDKVHYWVKNCVIFFVICYVILTMATMLYVPAMVERLWLYPVLFLVPIIKLLAIANIPRCISQGRYFFAFFSSSVVIVLFMFLFGLGIFPNMVFSNPGLQYSLTIYNASSSPKTLGIMLVIALIGMPLVLAYTSSIYWIFRGKVKLDDHSY